MQTEDARFWPHLYFGRSGFLGGEWVDDESLFRSPIAESTEFWDAHLEETDPLVWNLARKADLALDIEFSHDFDIAYFLRKGATKILLGRLGACWVLPGLTWPEAKAIVHNTTNENQESAHTRLAAIVPMIIFADAEEALAAQSEIEAILLQAGVAIDASSAAELSKWWLEGMTDSTGSAISRSPSGYLFFDISPRAADSPDRQQIELYLRDLVYQL